jgi:hypothetical protein
MEDNLKNIKMEDNLKNEDKLKNGRRPKKNIMEDDIKEHNLKRII